MANQAPAPLIYDLSERPKHKAFLFSRNKVASMFGGFGSAKTVFACIKAHLHLLTFPGTPGLVGRKTYPALRRSTLRAYLEVARTHNGGTLNRGEVIERYVDSPTPTLHYRNGSFMEFTTLDNVEKVRGPEIGVIVLDQAEEIAKEIYNELIARARYWNTARINAFKGSDAHRLLLEQFGADASPYNQILVVGNPAPNWVKEEFGPNHPANNDCWQVSTFENKKYLPEGYIEDLMSRYPQDWVDRYIHGSWDAFGGQVYKEFNPKALHCVPPMAIPSHWPRFVGWDHGYRNPTAVIAGAVDEMGNVILFREHYLADAAPEVHARAAWQMAENDQWPKTGSGKLLVHMDYAVKGTIGGDGKSIWDHYIDLGIYGEDAQKDVHAGILLVSKYLHPDPARPFPAWHPRAGEMGSPALFFVDGQLPASVNEMQIYQWEERKLDSNDPERPKKVNDHAVDAIRYLVMAANKAHAPELPGQLTPEELAEKANMAIASHAFIQKDPYGNEQDDY